MTKTQNIFQAILGQIDRYDMLNAGEDWLLAVSGGPDSMAMLYALDAMRAIQLLDLKSIRVAHLNHRLRGADSDADAEFVRRAAEDMGVEAIIESEDVADYARRNNLSIETAARRCRYDFLSRTAGERRIAKVALAHNFDDQVETILHRILRGTGIRGLAGMPAVRQLDSARNPQAMLIRPMLTLSRRQIEQYLAEQNIASRQDLSNLSDDYTRNRIRLNLLPMLREQFNPQVDRAVWRLGRTAEMMKLLSNEHDADALSQITLDHRENIFILNADRLAAMPRFDQVETVFEVMCELHISQRRIGYRQMTALLELLNEKSATEKSIQWPDGVRITRRGGELIFRTNCQAVGGHNPSCQTCQEITITVPGETMTPEDSPFITAMSDQPIRRFTAELLENRPGLLEQFIREKTSNEEMLDFDKLDLPLCVRTRRPGDRFFPFGASGDKTIGDFFTDRKIPIARRDSVALLADSRNILCVMGLQPSQKSRITQSTRRILKITLF
jgi:tRNA(Ile)-lysidine synthase